MASDAEFMAYVMGQIRNVPGLSHRRMFGEYAIYVGDKVVAFVCDDRVLLKPTDGNRAMIESPVEGAPFPGAKMYFVIDEHLDDSEFVSELFRVTERELPPPKPKPKKNSKKKPK
jgi:DNA transformation protein and related proteins